MLIWYYSVVPTSAPVYSNATTPAVPATTPVATSAPAGTVSASVKPSSTVVPASGAGKTFAASGVSLAGLLGLVAYLL